MPLTLWGVESLLIIRAVAGLIGVMWSRHLALRWGALHPWRRRPSRGRPHPRAQTPLLVKRGTECALVLRELLHGVRVVVVGRGGVDWRTTVLRWGAWRRVVHVGGHLTHDVSWRGGNGRGCVGHRRGRAGLVVHHVGCPRALGRVLHGVVDGWRGRRWRAIALLRWRHHVVGVGHYRLTRVVPRVVVWGWSRARARRERVTGGRGGGRTGVILDWHGDEVAACACSYRGDAEGLLGKRRCIMGSRWWLTVGVMTPVLEGGREVPLGLGQVRRGHTEAVRHLCGWGKVQGVLAACQSLGCPHVAVVDVGLQVTLGKVGALAALHDAAHVEGASQTLFDALDRVCAAEELHTKQHKRFS